jgi:GNAT superfamily N-acetyltransferase
VITATVREVPTIKEGVTFQVHAPDISDWVEIRHCEDRKNGNLYTAYDISQDAQPRIGMLRYLRDFPHPGCISITTMGVRHSHQRRGVGSALLERLRADNPDWHIDPGVTTETGLSFARHILEHEPEAPKALMPNYVEKTVGY